MKISIVIPVYNEADRLDACLQAISRQILPPFEVIVVDNNSTDDTVSIAQNYSFVKILHEPRQGVVHARNRGFNAAGGSVIGRIDADTILPPDWTEKVQSILSDETVDAVSGAISYYDFPYYELGRRIDLYFRQQIANGMGDEVFLYGANMAIRRNCWLKVRDSLCVRGGLHEDYDLAIHAENIGAKVVFDKHLHAEVSLRCFDTNFYDFWRYVWLNPKTYAMHGRKSQRHMYHVMALLVVFYCAIKLLHRSYDPKKLGYSWEKLWAPSTKIRVNPATFVD